MENEDWEALRARAADLVADVLTVAGATGEITIGWFHPGADSSSAGPYRIDQTAKAVGLNRGIVEGWLRGLPRREANARFDGLALRSAAALLFAPAAYLWKEAAALHIRSEQEKGLDESYVRAFTAANLILEGHRLDQRLLDLRPDVGDRLSELVRFDLEAHPTFDIYPRAAIIMGRPSLPTDLAQPAFDEFIHRFGVDEAESLTAVISEYVALDADAIENMVDTTAQLVLLAFPDAMGLAWGSDDGEDLSSEDVWPFQGRIPDNGTLDWDDLEHFVASSLARFSGQAGLDYGDALMIGLDDDAVTGSRIGAWARSGGIDLDLTQTDFAGDVAPELLACGWEQFGNAPESFHKSVANGNAQHIAAEFLWLLRDVVGLRSPSGLTLWGRGPAERVAEEMGWRVGNDQPSDDDS